MKRYVNCYPGGHTGVYRSVERAEISHGPTAYAVAVEIELPDPPHQWKVGDWFQEVGRPPLRIADIDIHGVMVVHGRWDHRCGALSTTQDHLSNVGATPCYPPVWFTEGGAS